MGQSDGSWVTSRGYAMAIKISPAYTVEVGYDEFCGALAARDLQPLWKMAKQLMPEVPLPTTRPWLWKWDDILPLAKRAGEIITLDRGGDRRVLAFANPGLKGLPFTSTTLWGAVQYLGPRESAPAHRHSPSAIRFVMTGSGVYTTVNGDAVHMEPGDLILTGTPAGVGAGRGEFLKAGDVVKLWIENIGEISNKMA